MILILPNTSFMLLSIPNFLYMIPDQSLECSAGGGGGGGNCISTILQKGGEEHFSMGRLVRVFKNFAVGGVDI